MRKINPYIFRTYDIRGKYPQELNQEVVYKIALAYGRLFPKLKKIVVQTDIRKSGQDLKRGLIKGLKEGNKEIIDIGQGPIPLMYFSVCYYPFDGGIAITASHLPKEYSGLKMQTQNAYPVISDDLEKIKNMVEAGHKTETDNQMAKAEITSFNPEPDYINCLTQKIKFKKPLKIVIDTGNGACGLLPEKIFKKLGCDVKTLFSQYDDSFPNHMPDPYEEKNLVFLQKEVLKQKADLGLAFDGDGDRIGIIDNYGRVVKGDFYLLILAREALKKKKGPVVIEIRTSMAFLEEMGKNKVKTYLTVGHHKAVLDKIKETKAVFGGETTGHLYFPNEYYLYDDAIFVSLKIAQITSVKGDLAAYIDTLPRYSASPEIFIPTADKVKHGLIKKLHNYLKKNNYDFIGIDGARINFSNGWALARAANTSPFIKCRFEGKTKKDLFLIEVRAIELFKKAGIKLTKENYQELGLD